MNKLNFLSPDKNNLYTYLYSGIFLISFSIVDVFVNSFFKLNLVFFLPKILHFLCVFASAEKLTFWAKSKKPRNQDPWDTRH